MRMWDDKGRFDWHLATVSRINNKKQLRVSVDYLIENRMPLNSIQEQWDTDSGGHIGHVHLLTLLQLPLIEVGNAMKAYCYSTASYP